MTVGWMVYAVAVAVLTAAGAYGTEAMARAAGAPTRWIWLLALVLAVGLPVEALRDGGAPGAVATAPVLAAADLGGAPAEVTGSSAAAVHASTPWRRFRAAALDLVRQPLPDGVRWGWGAASLALLLALAGGCALAARRRRRWPVVRLHGVPVHLSPGSGPAVSGVLRGQIVIPRRALTLAEEDLRAIVVHEDEHRRCRDVGLLAAALLLVAAQPWNPVLWWATGRLRLALETDCDRRTLRRLRSMTPARYGRLLLAEAAQGGPGLVPSIGLGRPARSLEARIRILTAGATFRAGLGGACLALVAVLAACEVPQPAAPLPTETARPEAAEDVWMRGPFEVRMPERPNELAAEAWSGEGRGELAVRVRFGPDGHPSRWAVDAFSDGLTVAMAEAATDVLGELRLTVGADGEPTERGWVPLWLLFDRGSVMLTLVSPDMYERDGIDEPGGEERLRRLMDTYRRLRGVGAGFLDIPASVGLRSGGRELLRTDRSSVGGNPTFGTGLDGGASVSARSVGTSTR